MLSLHFKKKLKFFAFGSDPPSPHAKKVNEGFPRGQGKRLLRIIIFLGLFKKFVIKTQGGLIQFF